MIDEEKTYREKGYYSTDLSHGSGKPVYAVCEGEDCQREGGRGRWVVFHQYRKLCHGCAMKNMHIEKCETPTEKLPWIDDDITCAEKGYRSTDLKPQSNKPVWAICQGENCEREGGRGRWVKFFCCRELCHLCAVRTEEFRMKASEMSRSKTGESASRWQGGISFEPYCEKFNDKLKESVRDKFDRKCFLCGEDEDDDMKLDVHHVNYDKECMCNGKECEFVPLHRGCHTRTSGNRELWERLIINVLWYEGWI